MSFVVPKEILEATTRCPRGFACLAPERPRGECPVERVGARNVLFLRSARPGGCPYLVPFGYSQICTCPVHCALAEAGQVFRPGDSPIGPPAT